MYAGRRIEEAPTAELFDRPAHPSTRGLMASIPRLRAKNRKRRLAEIPGLVPSLREPIGGCAFAPQDKPKDPTQAKDQQPQQEPAPKWEVQAYAMAFTVSVPV